MLHPISCLAVTSWDKGKVSLGIPLIAELKIETPPETQHVIAHVPEQEFIGHVYQLWDVFAWRFQEVINRWKAGCWKLSLTIQPRLTSENDFLTRSTFQMLPLSLVTSAGERHIPLGLFGHWQWRLKTSHRLSVLYHYLHGLGTKNDRSSLKPLNSSFYFLLPAAREEKEN